MSEFKLPEQLQAPHFMSLTQERSMTERQKLTVTLNRVFKNKEVVISDGWSKNIFIIRVTDMLFCNGAWCQLSAERHVFLPEISTQIDRGTNAAAIQDAIGFIEHSLEIGVRSNG